MAVLFGVKETTDGLVWSRVLYAADTWTMTQTDRNCMEAFEKWIRRSVENQLERQNYKQKF